MNDSVHGRRRSPRAAVRFQTHLGCLLAIGLLPAIRAEVPGTQGGDPVVISARASDDYIRAKRPDGSFQPETYAFGKGGVWGGALQDNTLDRLDFMDLARKIAIPLAAQNYLPTKGAKEAKLLIMVYWGVTNGSGGASSSVAYQNLSSTSQHLNTANQRLSVARDVLKGGGRFAKSAEFSALVERDEAQIEFESAMMMTVMENRQRERLDVENARILGYDSTGLIGTDEGRKLEFTALRTRQRDLIEELEDSRYFVVLMAYDFQLLVKHQPKLLWEARFSMRERGHDFGKDVAAMAQTASKYFGRATHGLARQTLPEGHVIVGELKVIEVVPDQPAKPDGR